MKILLIGLGGMTGAITRYWVDGFITRLTKAQFPWGTFAVNVSGSLLLGFVFAVMTERVLPHPALRAAVTIGFIGAYTTFSTLALETMKLADERSLALATLNIIGSAVVGLAAVWLGSVAGRAL